LYFDFARRALVGFQVNRRQFGIRLAQDAVTLSSLASLSANVCDPDVMLAFFAATLLDHLPLGVLV
jgi:hypothetical protein